MSDLSEHFQQRFKPSDVIYDLCVDTVGGFGKTAFFWNALELSLAQILYWDYILKEDVLKWRIKNLLKRLTFQPLICFWHRD